MNELSKYLCLLLRHQLEKTKLDMDEHGWVSVEQIIDEVNKNSSYNLDRILLKKVVVEDNMKRYEFDEENDKIRIAVKKLKLIYFYSPNVRGFEENEFNFSSKYNISFSDNKLKVSYGDKRYIEDFFGENLEINAIVGNNGSGKSSLLKRIYYFLRSRSGSWWGPGENNYIVVFEEVTRDNSCLTFFFAGDNYKCYQTKISGKFEKDLIIDLGGETSNSIEETPPPENLNLDFVPESERDDFSLKVDGSKKLFRLDEVYDHHKGKAVEVVLKKRIYLEGAYKKYVDGFFGKSGITSISLEKFMLGYDWDNDNFDEPLSKMTYDIFHSTK